VPAANLLLAGTYALLGVVLGPVVGVVVASLVPFLDIGMAQSPMLRPEPGTQTGPLLLALAWLAAVGIAATLLLRRAATPSTHPARLT
jgi:quinol-cytochrome oxidoreductase complex cytochrome b subunit